MHLFGHLPRRLVLILEAAATSLLVIAVVGVVYVKLASTTELSEQAKHSTAALKQETARADAALKALARRDAENACDAIQASGTDFLEFLRKSIGSGPRASDPTVNKFLDGLTISQADTYQKCLTKARSQ